MQGNTYPICTCNPPTVDIDGSCRNCGKIPKSYHIGRILPDAEIGKNIIDIRYRCIKTLVEEFCRQGITRDRIIRELDKLKNGQFIYDYIFVEDVLMVKVCREATFRVFTIEA